MKKTITILLLLSLLLSVLVSCQGTVPTGTVPTVGTEQSKESMGTFSQEKTQEQTKPVTEEKTRDETLPVTVEPQEETAELMPNATEKESMTEREAVDILEKPLGQAYAKEDGSMEYFVKEETARAIDFLYSQMWLDHSWGLDGHAMNFYDWSSHGKILRNYFSQLDEIVFETQCEIVFEDTVAFQEDNGAYYFPSAFLFYFNDRGITKEYISPEGVALYAPYAFADNPVLETVTLNLNGWYFSIGESAFVNCPSLKTINIPENELKARRYTPSIMIQESRVPHLFWAGAYGDGGQPFQEEWISEDWGFKNMLDVYKKGVLTNSIVDENPENFIIEDGVLVSYIGLGGHVVIPEGVTEIHGNAFYFNGNNVLSVTFPSTLKKICTWAFTDVPTPLIYEFPEGLEEIQREAFWLGMSQAVFLPIGIPEDCKVAEGAFPLEWMENYGREHQEIPEEFQP